MDKEHEKGLNERVKQPTSEDVARLAGVSRATVSAYLNGTRYVSDKSIMEIDKAIDILNYTPNELARSLKLKSNKTIGLLIPVLSKFYLPMLRSINERVHERGYTMIIGSSEEDSEREKEILQVFTSKKVTGILIVPCGKQNVRYIGKLQERGINLVQLNRRIELIDSDSVVSDTKNAIYNAVQHMAKTRGKKRIVLLGYDKNVIADLEKRSGYLKAVEDLGLQSFIAETIGHDQEYNKEVLTKLIAGADIDGIVCTTRTYMETAFETLKKLKISSPDEISLVGYDDPTWTTFVTPKLTVISEDRFNMGQTAVDMLFDRIEGKYSDESRHVVMKSEFIIRES